MSIFCPITKSSTFGKNSYHLDLRGEHFQKLFAFQRSLSNREMHHSPQIFSWIKIITVLETLCTLLWTSWSNFHVQEAKWILWKVENRYKKRKMLFGCTLALRQKSPFHLFTAINAASLVRDMRSAPTNPGVRRANDSKLKSSSNLSFSHWTRRILKQNILISFESLQKIYFDGDHNTELTF